MVESKKIVKLTFKKPQMKQKSFLSVLLFIACFTAKAQTTDIPVKKAENLFVFSGAIDTYYAYDFSAPSDRNRLYTTQAFRHNEFNLNWGYLQASYQNKQVRANLAFHTGTYVQANYAAEPNELTRLIAQANAGLRLKEGIWLDMGILPSHIGYESTFSGANEIYTRALMAENSPYFETGARLTAEVAEKWTLQFLVLNGWQNIHETNNAKSLGFSATYIPSDVLELSYNNYYGNEAPEGLPAKRRYFHNFYASYEPEGPFSLAGSVDYGRQELFWSNEKGNWYAAMLIARQQLNSRFAIAGRIEHYNDPQQIIVFSGTANGFQTSSLSLNLDYIPAPNFLFRLEARGYDSEDEIFIGEEDAGDQTLLLVTSLSLAF